VRLAGARNLIPADPNGLSDPYATLQLTGNTDKKKLNKTKVIKKTLNPEWNSDFEITVPGPAGSVDVKLFDSDVSADDPLGDVTIPLSDLVRGQAKDEWFGLLNVERGEVHVILTAVDFGVDPAAAVKQAAKAAPAPGVMAAPGTAWSWKESVPFTGTVSVTTGQWMDVSNYTRSIQVPHHLSFLNVTYVIPFVGNSKGKTRSRIRLNFDGQTISDGSKFNPAGYECHEVTLSGLVQNIPSGNHTITVSACVDGGELCIPYYDPKLIENTVQPAMVANVFAFGIA